jgi:hypothetical protein
VTEVHAGILAYRFLKEQRGGGKVVYLDVYKLRRERLEQAGQEQQERAEGREQQQETADGIPLPTLDPFDHQALGGLLQKTAEWIISTSFVPSRELSMLAALAIMGTFISRRYVGPSAGIAPNLYLVGLASTGRGKDGPLKAAKNIFASSGMTHFLGAGDVSSDAAIERLIREKPACLLTMDEIGTWLQEGLARNAPQYAKNRNKSMLELYTSSGEGGIWLGKMKGAVDKTHSTGPIHSPCMSILGVTTEGTFFKGVTEDNAKDGFLNRLTYFHIPAVKASRPCFGIKPSVPQEVLDAFSDAMEAWPCSTLLNKAAYRSGDRQAAVGNGPVCGRRR